MTKMIYIQDGRLDSAESSDNIAADRYNTMSVIHPILCLAIAIILSSSTIAYAQEPHYSAELPVGASIVKVYDDVGYGQSVVDPGLIADDVVRLLEGGYSEEVSNLVGTLLLDREGDITSFMNSLEDVTGANLTITPFIPLVKRNSENFSWYRFLSITQLYLRTFEVNLDIDLDTLVMGSEEHNSGYNLLIDNDDYPVMYYDGDLSYEEFKEKFEGSGIRLVIHNDLEGFPYGVYNRSLGMIILQVDAYNSFIHEFAHSIDNLSYGISSGAFALRELPASMEDAQFRRSLGQYLDMNGYHPSIDALDLMLDIDLSSRLDLINNPDLSIFDYIKDLVDIFEDEPEKLEAVEAYYDQFLLEKIPNSHDYSVGDLIKELDFMEKFTLSYYIQIASRNYGWVIEDEHLCEIQNKKGESRYFKILEWPVEGSFVIKFVEDVEG